MKRRAASLILALCMILLLLPSQVFAREPESSASGKPMIEEISAAEAAALAPTMGESPAPEYLTAWESLTAALRQAMVARQKVVTLYYATQTSFASGKALNDVVEGAMAYTGNPEEGDYLRWQFSGYRVYASYFPKNNQYYYMLRYYFVVISDEVWQAADRGNLDVSEMESSWYTTARQEEDVTAMVDAFLKTPALQNVTDYRKVQTIYNWLCENVYYDYDNLQNEAYKLKHSAYAAAINKTAVCQGYALLFYRLALACGIEARVIIGTADGGSGAENHAWNAVKLGGSFYLLDATWDAENRQEEHTWFLKGTVDFSDHTPGGELSYAALPVSSSSYEPTTEDLCISGDLNQDAACDLNDMQWLFERLNGEKSFTDETQRQKADFNGDTHVDILDYQALYEYVIEINAA